MFFKKTCVLKYVKKTKQNKTKKKTQFADFLSGI